MFGAVEVAWWVESLISAPHKPCMVLSACNLSTREAETGGSGNQRHSQLHKTGGLYETLFKQTTKHKNQNLKQNKKHKKILYKWTQAYHLKFGDNLNVYGRSV